MSKVTFDYDIKKDAWSWALIAKGNFTWGENRKQCLRHIPDDLLKKISKNPRPKAEKIVVEYLENHPKREYREKVIREEIKALKNIWRIKEKEYFKILGKITQKPICRKEFKGYFTTGFMCPYRLKEGWFMISMWHNIPFSIGTICHEILHFQFLHHYGKWCLEKGLSKSQLEDLKESLTFLLNEPEFENITLVGDKGYPKHQELRAQLQRIWQKEKDFKKFLEKAIKVIL